MKSILVILLCLLTAFLSFKQVSKQQSKNAEIPLTNAMFKTGDDMAWSNPVLNESGWEKIDATKIWEQQGHANYDGYAWYRFHVTIPTSLKNSANWKDSLTICLSQIDDVDEAFLNGQRIGGTGRFPDATRAARSQKDIIRNYHVAATNPAVHWDKENVIAVRVFDTENNGGINGRTPFISMLELISGIRISYNQSPFQYQNKVLNKTISLNNIYPVPISGTFTVNATADPNGKSIYQYTKVYNMAANQSQEYQFSLPDTGRITVKYSFTEDQSKKQLIETEVTPYILTPAVSNQPKINGAKVFGIRPGAPFLFKIPATGKAPLTYQVQALPKGLSVNTKTGIITGILAAKGDYKMTFLVKNSLGQAKRDFTVKVGDLLALTPPMGWNSWNCWGLTVSTERVESSANALLQKDLINHGWSYINIDDGWEAPARAENGEILTNEKFPDMKILGDYLHSKGLKFGIYSTPGIKTCGGYIGSLGHELQDASSYAKWGVDYLKYDMCTYSLELPKTPALEDFMKPFKIMNTALLQQKRDIVYSMSQYGHHDVWTWGAGANLNLWRITGDDIRDNWASLRNIVSQIIPAIPYTKPGRWSDPDMLVIGWVGWGPNLHTTHLTPDEQYTHISQWSILSAPLLLGCDLSRLDPFILNLITNDEVIAVDQDPKANQPKRAVITAQYEVWTKLLEDGSQAVGIFNLSDKTDTFTIDWKSLGLQGTQQVRDLWRQKDLGKMNSGFKTAVAPHGVRFIKVTKS